MNHLKKCPHCFVLNPPLPDILSGVAPHYTASPVMDLLTRLINSLLPSIQMTSLCLALLKFLNNGVPIPGSLPWGDRKGITKSETSPKPTPILWHPCDCCHLGDTSLHKHALPPHGMQNISLLTCSTVRGELISSPRRNMDLWVRTSDNWKVSKPSSSLALFNTGKERDGEHTARA